MKPADFLEQLHDLSNIRKDIDWSDLQKKYPYASSIQLLAAKAADQLSTEDWQQLRLHFENPLRLNQLLQHKVVVEASSVETKEEETEKKEALKKEIEEILTKSAPEEEENLEQEVTENAVIVEAEETTSPVAEDEDVLEMIKDLPEENPIEKAKAAEPQSIEEDAEVDETAVQDDPGDLMVMMSFTDWLQYFKAKKENEEEDKKGRDAIRSAWQKEKLAEAMDDEEDVVPDEIFEKAMKSVSFGDGLVTEPLAELYVQQGKIDKAIELYKKLSLLNPEKRAYFASRIKDLHL